jgi:hypothetical protein
LIYRNATQATGSLTSRQPRLSLTQARRMMHRNAGIILRGSIEELSVGKMRKVNMVSISNEHFKTCPRCGSWLVGLGHRPYVNHIGNAPAALAMQSNWEWKRIGNFGSLRERDRFVVWIRGQITDGIAKELDAPADAGERWFRHNPTGSLWRLTTDENPYGPGFWPANEMTGPRKTTRS